MSATGRVAARVRRRLLGPSETALVAFVPEADPILAAVGAEPASAHALAAHITVLYPFVAPSDAEAALVRLRALFADHPPVHHRLSTVGRFPGGVVFLEVDPRAALADLTRAAWGAFPEHPPYGGAFEEIVPHLTLSEHGDPPALGAVDAHLPLAVVTRSLTLVRHARDGWHRVGDIPLDG